MNNHNLVRERKERYLQLWIYLLPVVGIIPALWTLSRKQGSTQQQKVSRLSISLLLTWAIAYILLFLGADRASELLAFRLLYINALLTTGYFLTCFWLIVNLKAGKSHLSIFSMLRKTIDR